MRPTIQALLVNGECGDPALYMKFAFRRRAMLFDLGDLAALSPRQILQISHVFVSHAHMDHFAGFDRLLRICLGRPVRICLFGPDGFASRIEHKLAAYSWNLVGGSDGGLEIEVVELGNEGAYAAAGFKACNSFQLVPLVLPNLPSGVAFADDEIVVRYRVLDHGIPSLAFALEEHQHVNVWKDRLTAMGLKVGPWLATLKRALHEGLPDVTPIRVDFADGVNSVPPVLPLGLLKEKVVRIAPGQKIAYVVDASYQSSNAEKIVDLARSADQLFIEAVFLDEDRALAMAKRHLTAGQAGLLAHRSGVKRLIPFHFSPRYAGREDRLRQEAAGAFAQV